ncbi:J domain-containing protein [Pseudoxanthomonas mexicana]|uniref:J domain-containing protein n=1 Tax=Pseudoxanthomonas mexicana TaxID=128785 RepID=UPI00398B5041
MTGLPEETPSMKRWYGKLLGFIAGWLLMRHPLGGLIGLIIGHAFDEDWFRLSRDNPYQVFGLTRDASDAEIDQAYRRLMSQYHPDKMAGAAEDLRRQAEKKAGEINAAYDRIKTLRKR